MKSGNFDMSSAEDPVLSVCDSTHLQYPVSNPEPAVLIGGASVVHRLDIHHLVVVVGAHVARGEAETEPLAPSLDLDGVAHPYLTGVGPGQRGGLRGGRRGSWGRGMGG